MDTTESKQVTFSKNTLITFLSLFSSLTVDITDVRRTASALDELETALKEFGLVVTEEDIIDNGDSKRVFKLSQASSQETTPSENASPEVPAAPTEPTTPVEGQATPAADPNQTPINQ